MRATLEVGVTPGIHKGVPHATYREWDILSFSVVKQGRRSMLHLRHALTTPRQDTPALILGEAVHCAILEPVRFSERYAVPPKVDRRTKAGKAEWEFWADDHPHCVPLTRDEYERSEAIREAVDAHPDAARLLRGPGLNELSVVWEDSETGVLLKGRPDRITKYDDWTAVVDVKTTRDASVNGFSGACARYAYHLQAAMYLDGLDAVAPLQRRFFHVAVESEPPHGIAVYELTEAAIQQGRGQYRSILREYAKALETGEWPGYPTGVTDIDLPRWAQSYEEAE